MPRLSRFRFSMILLLVSSLGFANRIAASEISKGIKELGIRGEISDSTFLNSYPTWGRPGKGTVPEEVSVYDADGQRHVIVTNRAKPESENEWRNGPTLFTIGDKKYISFAHALASSRPGDVIEISSGSFSLPVVHATPRLETVELFHRLTSVWATDDYLEFYLVPRETWVAFGSLTGVTIRGAKGNSVPLAGIAAARLVDSEKNESEAQGNQGEGGEGGDGKKGGLMGGLRKGLGKLKLKDVQEGSILGMLQGGASYPPLKYVIDQGVTFSYMLPKVDYVDGTIIPRPHSMFRNLGNGYQTKCPNWVRCQDYNVANPFVISAAHGVLIENVDFSGPQTSAFDGEGDGSGLSHIAPLVAVLDSEDVVFKNCTFANSPGVAVLLNRSRRVTFENCTFLHGAEESIMAKSSDFAIINSAFLGNGRGKGIEHRVIDGDGPGDSKMIATTVEEFPQSKAIRLERSFVFAANSLFKFSGLGTVEGDCSSRVHLLDNVFDEPNGPAIKISAIGSENGKIEGNFIHGALACLEGQEAKCSGLQSRFQEKNLLATQTLPVEEIKKRLEGSSRAGARERLAEEYWAGARSAQESCGAAAGPSTLKYFMQMAIACREGWKGAMPDLSYFNLGSEDDRSALILGYAGCSGLSKAVDAGAKAARELRSEGYTSSLRIFLYKEGFIFRQSLKDFPLELTSDRGSISKFKTGTGGLFDEGSGMATIDFLKPGKYQIVSPLIAAPVTVELEEGITTEAALELK